MPQIELLDGKKIDFDKSINGFDLTKKISKSLEKIALIMEVDGDLKDLSHKITKDAKVRIITPKDKEGLEVIRHDAAHIMAMAVQELFPGTQVTIGPVIENGFFYDFARKDPFTSDDLNKIEKKMSEIIDRDVKTKREVWKRNEAIKHFKKIGEKYKAEIIESIPENEELSVYHHGETWHDLCRGPHLASSGKIGKAFKLTKVSGAYWRGTLIMKCFKGSTEHVGALKKSLMIIYIVLKKLKKGIIENLVKKWIFFILERKAREQYFGMRRDGCYFKDL